MKIDRRTLTMMAAAAGATLSLYAGPTRQTVATTGATAKLNPLANAPCMVDVDGKEVCTKELTWSELSDAEKAKLTAAISDHREAEAKRIAAEKAAADAEKKADAAPSKPIVRPVWGNGDGCPACGMG